MIKKLLFPIFHSFVSPKKKTHKLPKKIRKEKKEAFSKDFRQI
jgi:hypothetical protein